MQSTSTADLEMLVARAAIRRCVSAYASAVDRHDDARIAAVFHADAIDDHGRYIGGIPGFVGWVNHVHETNEIGHSHNVTTHSCEVDGDIAHAESYIIWVLRHRDRRTVLLGSGRYLDRLECRDGQWRIALRRVVREMRFECPTLPFEAFAAGFPQGRWDRSDRVYAQMEQTGLDGPAVSPREKNATDGEAVRHLIDRMSIRDCVAGLARAADRGDAELASCCAAPDLARAETIAGLGHARWTHNLTTHVSAVDGARATASSRILAISQSVTDMNTIASELVVDELERSANGWRIVARRRLSEWQRHVEAIPLNPMDGPQMAQRDRTDLSYQRPLVLPEGAR